MPKARKLASIPTRSVSHALEILASSLGFGSSALRSLCPSTHGVCQRIQRTRVLPATTGESVPTGKRHYSPQSDTVGKRTMLV
jgi:hypothetical protein